MRVSAAIVICAQFIVPSVAWAQQPVDPGWNDKGSVICPEGFAYSATDRLCWESGYLRERRFTQGAAANVLLILAGVGTIAGVYFGLKRLDDERQNR